MRASEETVKKFARQYSQKIIQFSDGSEWLVMYKAIKKDNSPWSDNFGSGKRYYQVGVLVRANYLSERSSSCDAGLHVTSLSQAKKWVKERDGRKPTSWQWYGCADKIIEVLVPIRDNIVIPEHSDDVGRVGLKIRCEELYVNREISYKPKRNKNV